MSILKNCLPCKFLWILVSTSFKKNCSPRDFFANSLFVKKHVYSGVTPSIATFTSINEVAISGICFFAFNRSFHDPSQVVIARLLDHVLKRRVAINFCLPQVRCNFVSRLLLFGTAGFLDNSRCITLCTAGFIDGSRGLRHRRR